MPVPTSEDRLVWLQPGLRVGGEGHRRVCRDSLCLEMQPSVKHCLSVLSSISSQDLPVSCDTGEAGPGVPRLLEGPELQAGDRVANFNNRHGS